tara:strand:- start:9685 stop:10314 length:630 start_codon:yes stop_codon:yes gene_type:complete
VLFAATLVIGAVVYGYLVQEREALRAEFMALEQRRADVVSQEDLLLQERLARDVAEGNARLERDLSQLRDENRELSAMIEQLEAGLAQRLAEAEAAAAAPAPVAVPTPVPESAAPAQEASPEPATPAVSGTWFVNFGSYVQRSIAERWAARLQVDRGTVVIQAATVSGQDLFRVRITGLQSQQQARALAAGLEERYGLGRLWVGRSDAS